MKIKFLLIAISCMALLSFTSCEKDEMEKGGGTGGGMTYGSNKTASISILRSLEQNTDFGTVSVNITNAKGEVIFDKKLDTSQTMTI